MKKLLDFCKEAESLVIYGAGAVANVLYLFLKTQGQVGKVQCFAVTEMGNNPIRKQGLKVIMAKDAVVQYGKAKMLLAVQDKAQRSVSLYLEELGVCSWYGVDGEALIEELYHELYQFPVQKNKILFSNMKQMGYGGNPKYIAEKLLAYGEAKGLDLVWVVSEEGYHIPAGIRTVEWGSYEYYYELATARVWIDNVRKASDVRKREGQYYIQTWHGAAPMKKVEKDVENRLPESYVSNAKRDSGMADLFLSGSRFYTELYRRSFWYGGEIMESGLPRQDVFWHGQGVRSKVFKYFGMDESQGMVLYAPTFRKDYTNQYYDLDFQAVRGALEERFGKRFVFAVSKHPENRNLEYGFEREAFVAVDRYEDFEELLEAADVLITDYSGCAYDFSYTRRPVFLYQRDYEQYKKERDFYIPMEQLPFVRAGSNEELIRCIREFEEERYLEKLDAFMDSMGNFDRGTASQAVADRIIEILDGRPQKIQQT